MVRQEYKDVPGKKEKWERKQKINERRKNGDTKDSRAAAEIGEYLKERKRSGKVEEERKGKRS